MTATPSPSELTVEQIENLVDKTRLHVEETIITKAKETLTKGNPAETLIFAGFAATKYIDFMESNPNMLRVMTAEMLALFKAEIVFVKEQTMYALARQLYEDGVIDLTSSDTPFKVHNPDDTPDA